MKDYFQLEIVTLDGFIYSGLASKLFIVGVEGELEIWRNHASLLTEIFPGPLWYYDEKDMEKSMIIYGGFLEVQPKLTIVLADSILRLQDLNVELAQRVMKNAENFLMKKKYKINYLEVRKEFAIAFAQLRLLRGIRNKNKIK